MIVQDTDEVSHARVELLRLLTRRNYRFVTPTPHTQTLVLARRRGELAKDVRDVLGWSLLFDDAVLDAELIDALRRADLIDGPPGKRQASARVSSSDGKLFLHSAYPTTAQDAVFFGPDSYRFADLITAELPDARDNEVIVDIGTGAGVGAIVAGTRRPAARIIATDINASALELAAVNAAAAGVAVETRCGDILAGFDQPIDVALANPPYIIDADRRAYRDGGAMHGAELSLRIVATVLPQLAARGRFILYTGSAIVAGQDAFREAAAGLAQQQGCALRYSEIDPDVFGEELAQPAYADVERIAAVAAIFDQR